MDSPGDPLTKEESFTHQGRSGFGAVERANGAEPHYHQDERSVVSRLDAVSARSSLFCGFAMNFTRGIPVA
jgi:hypothetical protein